METPSAERSAVYNIDELPIDGLKVGDELFHTDSDGKDMYFGTVISVGQWDDEQDAHYSEVARPDGKVIRI
jgi:hypothetical protein